VLKYALASDAFERNAIHNDDFASGRWESGDKAPVGSTPQVRLRCGCRVAVPTIHGQTSMSLALRACLVARGTDVTHALAINIACCHSRACVQVQWLHCACFA
jgi:hypothetical protein